MKNIKKPNGAKAYVPKPETAMDKTTRVVRGMIDEEEKQRQVKITRLRKARLEREASAPPETTTTATRKTRRS